MLGMREAVVNGIGTLRQQALADAAQYVEHA
jgi:hypothetical protein